MNNPFGIEQTNKEEFLKVYHEAKEEVFNYTNKNGFKITEEYKAIFAKFVKAKNACMLAGIRL